MDDSNDRQPGQHVGTSLDQDQQQRAIAAALALAIVFVGFGAIAVIKVAAFIAGADSL